MGGLNELAVSSVPNLTSVRFIWATSALWRREKDKKISKSGLAKHAAQQNFWNDPFLSHFGRLIIKYTFVRALIRRVRMPFVSAFISNQFYDAVTSESWVIGQNVNKVREKITEISGLRHFVSSLASQNCNFWLQMAITQRRNIKDVQILAYTEKLKLYVTPKYKSLDQKQFLRVGKKYEQGCRE